MRRHLLLLSGVVALFAATPAVAAAANGDVTCTGVAPASVPHDLIVPSGVGCGATGSTVGHDIIVEPTGALFAMGITVGHDVIGHQPAFVEIAALGGRNNIGHDVSVNGSTGPGNNGLCNTTVQHDVTFQNSATQTIFGACGGVDLVGHDGVFQNNSGLVDIESNGPLATSGFGHDLTVQNNSDARVVGNDIGHDCKQQNNTFYTGAGHRLATAWTRVMDSRKGWVG